MEGVHLTQCPQLPVSNPHDNLAYRLAREHVLNRVRHAFQAVERALAVDERDQLAARVQIEHALLAAGDRAEVLGPRVAVDGLLAARDCLRLPEERARLRWSTATVSIEVEYHLGVPARHPGVPGDN